MLKFRAVLPILCAVVFTQSARSAELTPAQAHYQQQVDTLLKSSIRHINGKETPELVPYVVRMTHFFSRYARGTFKSELDPQLSAEDVAVLTEYASRHEKQLEADHASYRTAWTEIGARAQHLSAVDIASEMSRADESVEAAQSARFRGVIGRLSPSGRATVTAFAFERVRPQVMIEDPFVLANGDPQFYKEQIVGAYGLLRSGKSLLPPPAQTPKTKTKTRATTLSTDSGAQGSLGMSPNP
jgi:hypothetical protein